MLGRPADDGDRQFRLLEAAWDRAVPYWRDEAARRFQAGHWAPLATEARSYLQALGRLTELLEAAENDTED